MTIALHRHFIERVHTYPPETRAAVFEAMLDLPDLLRNPAKHSALGLRKLHPTGVWEIRIGLQLRALLQLTRDTAVFRFMGTHSEVRKYLRNL